LPGAQESDLRCFERALLQELGYGLTLETDAAGVAVDPDAHYAYEIERGPVRLPGPGGSALAVERQDAASTWRARTSPIRVRWPRPSN
jgi:recombinational DNA repair protein (RecF pathway)